MRSSRNDRSFFSLPVRSSSNSCLYSFFYHLMNETTDRILFSVLSICVYMRFLSMALVLSSFPFSRIDSYWSQLVFFSFGAMLYSYLSSNNYLPLNVSFLSFFIYHSALFARERIVSTGKCQTKTKKKDQLSGNIEN